MRPESVRVSLLLIPLLLGVGCSSSSDKPTEVVEIHQDLAAPDSSSVAQGIYLQRPVSMARVGDSLLVLDNRQSKGLWFSLDGLAVGEFSRPGSGPGELQAPRKVCQKPGGGGFWVLSGYHFQSFSREGHYLAGFTADFSPHDFDITPNGLLAVTSYAGENRGGLSLLDEGGHTLWSVSTPLEFEGAEAAYRITNRSIVCAAGAEIWQLFTCFNVVRVFSLKGDKLREFGINESHIEAMDQASRDQVELLKQGVRFVDGQGVGPRTIHRTARHAFGSVWIVSQFFSDVLGEDEKSRDYISRIGPEGEVQTSYYFEEDRLVGPQDVCILADEPKLRLVAALTGPYEAEVGWFHK